MNDVIVSGVQTLVVKSDQQASIVDVKNTLMRGVEGWTVMSEESPVGASAANVMIYFSARKQLERFPVFLEAVSRFEFDVRRCGNHFFQTIRIFGVFKVQSHTMWPYMCM